MRDVLCLAFFICLVMTHQSPAEAQLNPGVGFYCSSYIARQNRRLWVADTDTCPHCNGKTSSFGMTCPWACGSACRGINHGFGGFSGPNQYKNDIEHICEAGCRSVASCTAVPNSVFTGSGTQSYNCPFECNSGYYKDGIACALQCNPGQYNINSASCGDCTAVVTNGYFTGTGTNSYDCPFSCNTGYYKSDMQYCESCIAVADGYFTGSGTTATNCPFVCNAGFTPSGRSCVHVSSLVGNGYIQYPVTGEYCETFYDVGSFQFTLDVNDCGTCEKQCAACKQHPFAKCPWNCHNGCEGILTYEDWFTSSEIYDYTCNAGCVVKSACTPIANAQFTGSGITVGDSTSCPFTCNAGYTKTGSSCILNIVTCPEGQYNLNSACTPCRTCTNGYWLSGCAGSNAGDCLPCEN
jgi:hypothetical protein